MTQWKRWIARFLLGTVALAILIWGWPILLLILAGIAFFCIILGITWLAEWVWTTAWS